MVMTMVVAPAVPAVIDQFDFRLAAIVHNVRRGSFQRIENAACARHAGDRIDRPDGRHHGSGAGETKNACKE
jgi:hypothetical protein